MQPRKNRTEWTGLSWHQKLQLLGLRALAQANEHDPCSSTVRHVASPRHREAEKLKKIEKAAKKAARRIPGLSPRQVAPHHAAPLLSLGRRRSPRRTRKTRSRRKRRLSLKWIQFKGWPPNQCISARTRRRTRKPSLPRPSASLLRRCRRRLHPDFTRPVHCRTGRCLLHRRRHLRRRKFTRRANTCVLARARLHASRASTTWLGGRGGHSRWCQVCLGRIKFIFKKLLPGVTASKPTETMCRSAWNQT